MNDSPENQTESTDTKPAEQADVQQEEQANVQPEEQSDDAQPEEQKPKEEVEVQTPAFSEAEQPSQTDPGRQIEVLLNTSFPITACLGEVEIEVSKLLELGHGSILVLNKNIGDPIDLQLNGANFATGQLVVVDSQLAIRVIDILPVDEKK